MKDDLVKFYTGIKEIGVSTEYLGRVKSLDFSNINKASVMNEGLLFVKDFTLPAPAITTAKLNMFNGVYQQPSKVINNANSIKITFFVDQSLYIRGFFDNIIEVQAEQGINDISLVNKTFKNITLEFFDTNNTVVYQLEVLGAFIEAMSELKYDRSGSGAVQTLTVTFAYNSFIGNVVDDKVKVTAGKNEFYKPEYASSGNGKAVFPGLYNASGGSERSSQTGSGSRSPGLLGSLVSGLNTIAQTARAVGGTAAAIRGAGRAIRGR